MSSCTARLKGGTELAGHSAFFVHGGGIKGARREIQGLGGLEVSRLHDRTGDQVLFLFLDR